MAASAVDGFAFDQAAGSGANPGWGAAQLTPDLRRVIVKIFTRKYNLQLHTSALHFIASTLDAHGLLDQPDEWADALEALAKELVDGEVGDGGSGSMVTQTALERVYARLVAQETSASTLEAHDPLTEGETVDPARYFHVIDAFKMPRIRFDQHRKTFERSPNPPTVLPMAASKPACLRERLNVIRNVVLRNEHFLPPLLAAQSGPERDSFMKLTSTKNLLGRQGQRFLLLGMLCTGQDGRYCLEDADGSVGLDLEEAIPGEGIFTEGCIALVEGEYTEQERIRVSALGHPPSESRTDAKRLCGHVDFLGTGAISLEDEAILRTHEQAHEDLNFVVISDVHLDQAKTLTNLRAMMQGYVDADFIPMAFVLCGDFCSTTVSGSEMVAKYQYLFNQLADVITSFPAIRNKAHFIFVPGPTDPFSTPLLPRPGLPAILTTKLAARLGSRAHFVSNPCRIRYFGQEIVIMRDNIMSRALRNTIRLKDEMEEGALKRFLVSTLLDQAHLCPFAQHIRPTLWDFDHTLRLYPMPNALILADKYDRFELTYEGCHVFNPGSFKGNAYGWATYYPATGRAERSELPNA
ncbi:DNA-directed DNA polymerase epsilon, subunit B [Tilletia horrida]|nr:DNA-directed DNA polymerase epsilon, subunit B [Tilletia horrida]